MDKFEWRYWAVAGWLAAIFMVWVGSGLENQLDSCRDYIQAIEVGGYPQQYLDEKRDKCG